MNDEDLHRLMQAADPARTLPPLTRTHLNALTEHAMTTTPEPTTRPVARRRPVAPGRFALGAGLALVGAAAAAVIAVPLLTGPAAAPTALKAPATTSGLETACAPVTADFIARADIAFRGEVTGIRDGIVTMQVLHRYTGDVAQTATIPQGQEGAVDGSTPVFTLGDDYLIAATDRTVLSCGSTGTDTPALRAIYDRAFTQ